MSHTICLSADAMGYPAGGGHFWVYMNWALSLQALGCRVIWLERVHPRMAVERWREQALLLRRRMQEGGLHAALALYADVAGAPLPDAPPDTLSLAAAEAASDALISLRYGTNGDLVARFRRSALVDIDPGLLQIWISQGHIRLPRYDLYFSIGENIMTPDSRVPRTGHDWLPTRPCVALDAWKPCDAPPDAPFTTVTHWYADEWITDGGEVYANDKRTGFLPFLDMPSLTRVPLELAVDLGNDETERSDLRRRGWRLRDAGVVAGTPGSYHAYIAGSRGEFSCVKPSCIRLQTAWISDRTLCYLASGKPAVIQHTGPSRQLPDDAGLLRFHDPAGAVRALEAVASDYARHSRLARQLAEAYFDGRRVAGKILERLLDGAARRG